MLLVIDGNSIMNRAFYALPLSLNSGAVPTNAVYGFMNVFYKAIDTYNPDCVLVAFDMPGATFRHEKYEAYKQGRKAAPEELSQQFPVIKELLKTAGIRIQEVPGYEADDIIGTVVRKAEFAGMESIILSGDRDSLQLISEKTRVLLVKKGISYTELTDADTLHETMGITPRQVIDFKALAGDASDNIPGVPGVGEKTALKLLQDYSDLDEIYKNIDSIPGKLGEKLAQGKESAYLSRELATIYTSVPLDYEPSQCIYRNPSGQKVRDLYMRLGLRSLLSRVGEAPQGQLSLEFDSTAEEEEYETLTDIRLLTGEYLALCAEGDKITCSPDGKSVYALENGLEDLFKNNPGLADKKIIAHDIKSMMHKYNLRFNSYFDTMVAEYLIDANAARYTPERLLAKYSLKYALNAANIYCLYEKQLKVLQETGMLDLMLKIEMPLLQVLYDMETAGFVINRESLIKLQHEFSGVLAGLEERIFELAGESFNINSPKQISRILFDKLNLRAGRKTKTGFSTDSDVLEGLADKHPIVPLIMEYRSYMKLKGTYIDGMLSITETGNCIHTRFNQTVASTGRISSVEPNLQNIPVRTELGRRIRLAFVPRSEDYMLVDADYSQIELRVLAHLSGDEQMIAAFLNDEDIHASTAATVFKIPLSEVTPQQRNFCKAVNFGVVYGISDFGLARNLGIPRKTAHEFIEAYFAQYPSIKAYLDGLKKFAYEKGYAQTLFGRRRQIPELKSANRNVRLAGERIAMNMPIQGTAADIIKMAMINVNCEIKNNNYKSRLILQVHDELIIDAHRDELDMMKKMLKEKMENVVKLSVPIKVELSVGKSWFETK